MIFLAIGITACREKEKPQEDLGLISLGEAKDYLLFKPGSWWVYRNSYTNELDSMKLYFCYLDTIEAVPSTKRKFSYEEIGFWIYSYRDMATYNSFDHGMSAEVLDFSPRSGWECKRSGGLAPESGTSFQFFYPFDKIL